MGCKRITISLTEKQFDKFREILPEKANVSDVLSDQISMFIGAQQDYGDEFMLDVMYGKGNYSIRKNPDGSPPRRKIFTESKETAEKPKKAGRPAKVARF